MQCIEVKYTNHLKRRNKFKKFFYRTFVDTCEMIESLGKRQTNSDSLLLL